MLTLLRCIFLTDSISVEWKEMGKGQACFPLTNCLQIAPVFQAKVCNLFPVGSFECGLRALVKSAVKIVVFEMLEWENHHIPRV